MVNLQHDCYRGHCLTSQQEPIRQEREITSRSRSVLAHTDDDHFIVNIQSLHNYHTISLALPPRLRCSGFVIEDETALCQNAAAQIREKKRQDDEATVDHSDMEPPSHPRHENSGSTNNEEPLCEPHVATAPITTGENGSTTVSRTVTSSVRHQHTDNIVNPPSVPSMPVFMRQGKVGQTAKTNMKVAGQPQTLYICPFLRT